ncbi:hypothetical protein GOODEAATRI_002351 [Goodea atripinnis]|uniref:Uncharacterized protein n=1 Tax=Goodea atripinnis TaxID=208336 RepID=A0ABV0NGU9_9TELE
MTKNQSKNGTYKNQTGLGNDSEIFVRLTTPDAAAPKINFQRLPGIWISVRKTEQSCLHSRLFFWSIYSTSINLSVSVKDPVCAVFDVQPSVMHVLIFYVLCSHSNRNVQD